MSAFLPHELERYRQLVDGSVVAEHQLYEIANKDVVHIDWSNEEVFVKRDKHTIGFASIQKVRLEHYLYAVAAALLNIEEKLGRPLEIEWGFGCGGGEGRLQGCWAWAKGLEDA